MARTDADHSDPYFHRELTLRAGGRRLALHVSQELFSSHTIDTGSLRLIKTLELAGTAAHALDLGCGTGPIALALSAMLPEAGVHAVDRDALALEYTAANAARNGLCVGVAPSLGVDGVHDRYDVVASNVPGKGAPGFHRDLLAGIAERLVDGGIAAIVIVNPLVHVVDEYVEATGSDEVYRGVGAEHTVVHLRPPPTEPRVGAFERGVYDRGPMTVRRGRVRYEALTVYGIAEFDTLGYDTALALDITEPRLEPGMALAVVNPGQGHLALGAANAAPPGRIQLLDRDLLALRTSRRNLERAGHDVVTQHGWRPSVLEPMDVAMLRLRRKEPPAVHRLQVDELLSLVHPGGFLVIAGSASAVGRAVTGRRVTKELRGRGHAAVMVARPARSPGSDA